MKRIAFIIQQYGEEVNGGAEVHCRQLAERLALFYDVEVLTTCSVNGEKWANHFNTGLSTLNNVTVRRFFVSRLRNEREMLRLEKKIRHRIGNKKTDDRSVILNAVDHFLYQWRQRKLERLCSKWIIAQGPFAPSLPEFIKKNESSYHCFIFFTYLFYPTVFGLPISPQKSIFIPTAHDEWALRLPVYRKLFSSPFQIMFNTSKERELIKEMMGEKLANSMIAGAGISDPVPVKYIDIRKELNISEDFILFIGRVDANKLDPTYLDWFLKYIEEGDRKIKLVIIGSLFMKIPEHNNIISAGFVSEEFKLNAIKQSLFLFQPSRFESLSLVVLEAFVHGKPVLVNNQCNVMEEHIRKSEAGLSFSDYPEFRYSMDTLLDDRPAYLRMGSLGEAYVKENYQWNSIIDQYRDVIDKMN